MQKSGFLLREWCFARYNVSMSDDFIWETYDKRNAPMSKQPQVTIQSRGTISMNLSAYMALGSPQSVELLFDRERKVIGFRPAKGDNHTAYPLRKVGPVGNTYIVAATSFLKYYGVPLGVPSRYEAELSQGVLVVDLNSAPQFAPSNRSRRQQIKEPNVTKEGEVLL